MIHYLKCHKHLFIFLILIILISTEVFGQIGIASLKGEPQIINCVPDLEFNSGDSKNSFITVKNIGENAGSFYGTIQCGNNIFGSVSEKLFEEGETGKLTASFSGTNKKGGTITENCKITIIDRKSQEKDYCFFDVGVEYIKDMICAPNSKICLNDKQLKVCNDKGIDYKIIECTGKCQALDGDGECLFATSDTIFLKESGIQDYLIPILFYLFIIAIIIGVIVLIKKKKTSKDKKFCKNCGEKLSKDSGYCSECGKKI